MKDRPEDAAKPAGGEFRPPGGFAAEGFVDGDDAAHFEGDELGVVTGGGAVGEDFEGGLDDFEAGTAGDRVEGVAGARGFEFAVEGDLLAWAELIFEVGAVEPDALHCFEDGGRSGEEASHGGFGVGGWWSDADCHFEDGIGSGA